MGNIIDRIADEINYDDVNHDWWEKEIPDSTSETDSSSPTSFFESAEPQITDPWIQDGFKLIKQSQPFKGIRYGGPSSLDAAPSVTTAFGASLDSAIINKAQVALDKLVDETFYGSIPDTGNDTSNEACGSAGAEGVFDGEYWMGNIKAEWIKKTSAKPILDYGDYSDKIIETLNIYAPKQKMAPARALAQVMIEGGHYKHTRDAVNPWGCKGIGQFAKGSWKAPYNSAIKKYPELKKYDGSWSAHSSNGGPGHPVLGVVVMMEYMLRIHNLNMEKKLPGKDEDYWWSAIGYLMGPGRAANILKACNGDRDKCDEEAEKVGIGSYSKKRGGKGVAFYGNTMLKKWKEYSEAVPKSEKDQETEADTPETESNACATTPTGDVGNVTSKVKWTPGQELSTPIKDFSAMNASAYGVPRGKAGAPWMKGEGKAGIHLEMDAAIKGCNAAMKKEAGLSAVTYGGFRDNATQLRLYNAWLAGRNARAARPGNSAHECGYAIDLVQGGKKRKWWHENSKRFGLTAYGNLGQTEDWHFQIHPDLAYVLKQKYEARGKKWD